MANLSKYKVMIEMAVLERESASYHYNTDKK